MNDHAITAEYAEPNLGAIPGDGRGPAEERMVRFGYYLNLAANLLNAADPRLRSLVEADYEDPTDVCREASAWCYGPGRELAVGVDNAERDAHLPHQWVIGSRRGWLRCGCGAEFESGGFDGTGPSVEDQHAVHVEEADNVR